MDTRKGFGLNVLYAHTILQLRRGVFDYDFFGEENIVMYIFLRSENPKLVSLIAKPPEWVRLPNQVAEVIYMYIKKRTIQMFDDQWIRGCKILSRRMSSLAIRFVACSTMGLGKYKELVRLEVKIFGEDTVGCYMNYYYRG